MRRDVDEIVGIRRVEATGRIWRTVSKLGLTRTMVCDVRRGIEISSVDFVCLGTRANATTRDVFANEEEGLLLKLCIPMFEMPCSETKEVQLMHAIPRYTIIGFVFLLRGFHRIFLS